MTFAGALYNLKGGQTVARQAWGQDVLVLRGDRFLYRTGVAEFDWLGNLPVRLAEDILGKDWVVVHPEADPAHHYPSRFPRPPEQSNAEPEQARAAE